jgi:hypothetical protein
MSEELNDQDALSRHATGGLTFATDIDQVLVNLLNEMEAIGVTFDLTLTVHGFLISGTPIFIPEYLERQGALMDHGSQEYATREEDNERAEALQFLGAAIRDRYYREAELFKLPEAAEGDMEAKARRDAARDKILSTPRAHIMLKRVTMIAPSGEQIDAPFWRGRLSHVAGWWVGRSALHDYGGIDPDADAF